jgi:hypothetical protein
MKRRAYGFVLVLTSAAVSFLSGCGGSSSKTGTTPPPAGGTISATSGITQSIPIGTAFAPLVATVTSGGEPAAGVMVTFTAPSSGASGTFTGGKSTVTQATDSKGNASVDLTANATTGTYSVTATAPNITGTATFNLTNTAPPGGTITATGGTPQSALINTAFATALQATVMSGGVPVSGVKVTFTAPSSNASGTFGNKTTTETDTTDSNGMATTSSKFTANGIFGSYTVTATPPSGSGISGTATFNLTNNVSLAGATLFSFNLSGLEAINTGPNFYALVGSVAIDSNGNVIAGEQDYNDGFGITSPQPDGDSIIGGTLSVSPSTGQGTLSLITNNPSVGVASNGNGVETLGVQFVNAKHALIIQFDGSATSSGSMDFQTLPSTLSGGYAFTLSGVDASSYSSEVYGGVFTLTGNTLQGIYDVDDIGANTTPTMGTPFTASISTADQFGRGTILGSGIANTLNYYIVGPEAIRIIDVDSVPDAKSDSALGSAFGQGAGTFNNGSLGTSVFGLASNSFGLVYGAVGMLTASAGTFTGVADDNEVQNTTQASAAAISGSYSISNTVGSVTYNGYGSLTIPPSELGDVSVIGIYMTDPNLNLSDPNNTATGLGGALLADLDGTDLVGTGVLVPQTDTSTSSFSGGYAFGAQEFNLDITGGEFDFIGQGTVTGLALSGSGMVSDPFGFFGGLQITSYSVSSGVVTFTFTANNGFVPSVGAAYTIENTNTGLDGTTVTVLSSPAPSTTQFSANTTVGNSAGPVAATATPSPTVPTYSGVTFSGTAVADSSNPGRYTLPLAQPLPVSAADDTPLSVVIYQASGGELFWLENDADSVFLGSLQQQGSLSGIPAVRKNRSVLKTKEQ